jgi:outer membrane protein TolC
MSKAPLLLLLMCASACHAADAVAPDRLAQLNRMEFLRLVQQAPQVHAAQARVRATQAEARVAPRLPDPVVSAGYDRTLRPTPSDTLLTATVEQVIPRWGERSAQRDRANAVVVGAEADLAATAGDTAALVATALAEQAGAAGRIALLTARLNRLDTQGREVRVRIAAGRASALDLLDLQTRIADAQLERDAEKRVADDAAAEARRLLGIDDATRLPPFAAPDIPQLAPQTTPELRRAQADVAMAQAERAEAYGGRFPETTVGVRVGRALYDGAETTYGLTLGLSLPLWPARPLAAEDAAAQRVLAARAMAAAAQARIHADLTRAERALRLAQASRTTADAVQTAAAAQEQTLSAASATADRASMTQILDALDRVDAARARALDAEVSAQTARADLWRLLPPTADELGAAP